MTAGRRLPKGMERSAAFVGPAPAGEVRRRGHQRCSRFARRAGAWRVSASIVEGKLSALEALKKQINVRLVDELVGDSDPDCSIYADDVLFQDPLNNFRGAKKQEQNIRMLKDSAIIKATDFVIHSTWIDEPKEAVMVRWTLALKFKFLPWQPVVTFTGTSEYGMNDGFKVSRHIDKWDSVTRNEPFSIEAVGDLITQMTRAEVISGDTDHLPWNILRRDVSGFEIRGIKPIKAAACTYDNRADGMGLLDQYFGGVNEARRKIPRFRPLLLHFPSGISNTDSKRMLTATSESKPSPSLVRDTKIVNLGPMTVATMSFKEPIVPEIVKYKERQLEYSISKAGYIRSSKEVYFAQYTAVFTLPWLRRNEVWIPLYNE